MINPDLMARSATAYEAITGRALDRVRIEALTTAQRLDELAGADAFPDQSATIRKLAFDWMEHLAVRRA